MTNTVETCPAPDSHDPIAAAKSAHLRYVTNEGPGIRRERDGEKFRYVTPDGSPVDDTATLARIRSIALPPAYTDVWICPDARGHLQATGRDARGRKQYRYHPRWQATRDATKYDRMIHFGDALPRIRARVEADLGQRGLPRTKVLAAVVRLLEKTRIRVGNEEYARTNGSFGLTTLRNDHVDVDGNTLHFHFKGKSGVRHRVDLRDARLARIISRCQELPEQSLFEFEGDDGNYHRVSSGDVNDYLRETAGAEFTAKDFRTWAGTVLCALHLAGEPVGDNKTATTRTIVQAVKCVSERLGNTPSVCRKCYIHPVVLEAFSDGTLPRDLSLPPGKNSYLTDTPSGQLSAAETAVLMFLRGRSQAT